MTTERQQHTASRVVRRTFSTSRGARCCSATCHPGETHIQQSAAALNRKALATAQRLETHRQDDCRTHRGRPRCNALPPLCAARRATAQPCVPRLQLRPCREYGPLTRDVTAGVAPAGTGRPDKNDGAAGRDVDVCCEPRMRADIMAARRKVTLTETVAGPKRTLTRVGTVARPQRRHSKPYKGKPSLLYF